ncbi:DUF397 domain-containing protein [Streptomyces botrytidirepellens]|uniref:DUF397 domain-containing protein n=1 Tax=Streptomyces botrytidirepellens TaxID=2486417 RepID=A0A3M8WME2_9ACTN|nr:DUF397 domain-containing protein [Streptomyces botrytidirepellens]RNG30827.1 DUF397 domain-containing protein [Streptomyces botrytidirepellens]
MTTTPELDWFKSSYSGSSGDNCVEVAVQPNVVHIRDSTDTRIGSLTVSRQAWSAFTSELGWHKSSYSGSEGDNCVEVAIRPHAVHIRDSKDTGTGQLAIPHAAWADFVAQL